MAQQDLPVHTVRTPDELRIEYLITGSFVTSLQGEPRSTHNIDVEVQVSAAKLRRAKMAGGSERHDLPRKCARQPRKTPRLTRWCYATLASLAGPAGCERSSLGRVGNLLGRLRSAPEVRKARRRHLKASAPTDAEAARSGAKNLK